MNHDHHKAEQLTRDQVVEDIVESFAERLTQGEKPSISEYIKGHPEFERELRDVLSAMMLVDQVDRDLHQQAIPPEPVAIQEDVVRSRLGDFHLFREAGRGGMGIVYEAEQLSLGRRVALKVLPTSVARDETFLKRFEREAKAAAKLHHTNIVPVFGVGQDHGQHFYAMQFIDGQSLDGVLQEVIDHFRDHEPPQESEEPFDSEVVANRSLAQSLASGRFEATLLARFEGEDADFSVDPQVETITARHSKTSPLVGNSALLNETCTEVVSRRIYFQSIARIGQQVADALAYSHKQGILHRDIKPSNIILDHHGSAWVTDFGLAKVMDQHNLTQTGDILGTLRYMAPECFEARGDVRSDVYSLGMTLYELAGMQPAFDETDRNRLLRQVLHETPMKLSTLDPGIPADLVTIVHKAIERDPNHRYQTAEEMADDLHRYLHDEPIKARRLSSLQKLVRVCRRNPLVASLTGLVATLLLVVAVGSTFAAVKFESLAADKGELAEELNSALGKAEGNLDLALEALDTVYLDAVGSEKLLSQPISRPDSADNRDWVPQPKLSELEKTLLEKGLSFYDELARQNPATDRAFVQTALAYQRVGLMQAALGDHDSAAAAYQTAVERFEKLTQQDPANADHFRKLGEAYRGLGSSLKDWGQAVAVFDKARTAYTAAIDLQPKNAELIYRRGTVSKQKGDMESYSRDVMRAVTLDPHHPVYLCAAASASEPAQSLDFALRALDVAPENPLVHATLGEVYGTGVFHLRKEGDDIHIVKDREKAINHFNQAVKLASGSPEYLGRRAHFYSEIGDYRRAMGDVDRILTIDPTSIEALKFRSQLNNATGHLKLALKDLLVVLNNDPHDYECLDRLAAVYRQMHKWEQELEALNHAVAVRPNHWINYKHRAVAHANLKHYDKALIDFEKAMRLNPADASTLAWMGEDILQTPDSFQDSLLELAGDLTAEFREMSSIFVARGRLYLSMGKHQDALEDFSKAAELSPRNANPWYYLALTQLREENYRESQKMSEMGLARNPQSYTCLRIDGISSYYLGDYAHALNSFSRALELYPQNINILIWRAATLLHLGRVAEALTDCRRALGIDAEEAKSQLLDQILQEAPFRYWSWMLGKSA